MDDYKSAEELADHIKYLDKNDTAYIEYFEWREKYEIVTYRHNIWLNGSSPAWGFCQLCDFLKRNSGNGTRKSVADLWQWWTVDAECLPTNWMPWYD